MAPRFQPCFYGTRRWCRGPALASRDAAVEAALDTCVDAAIDQAVKAQQRTATEEEE